MYYSLASSSRFPCPAPWAHRFQAAVGGGSALPVGPPWCQMDSRACVHGELLAQIPKAETMKPNESPIRLLQICGKSHFGPAQHVLISSRVWQDCAGRALLARLRQRPSPEARSAHGEEAPSVTQPAKLGLLGSEQIRNSDAESL